MTRSIDSSVSTAAQGEVVRPVVMVRLDFSSGIVAAHTGVQDITYNGDTYLGLGNLGGISGIEEGIESRPYSVNMTLSGIPSGYISIALGEHYQGRDAKAYMAFLDSDYQVIGNPVLLFNGRMDTMDIQEGETATINLTVQSRMADWDRPRVRRYNHEDQIIDYPNDKGFEFVNQMVEREIVWGRESKV